MDDAETTLSGSAFQILAAETGKEEEEEEEEEIYLPRTITILNKKNTILKLARSRLSEKQKAIYAGRQHC